MIPIPLVVLNISNNNIHNINIHIHLSQTFPPNKYVHTSLVDNF